MIDQSRRGFLGGAALAAMAPALNPQTPTAQELRRRENESVRQLVAPFAAVAGNCTWSNEEQKDRQRVLDCGCTDDEATTWLLLNRMAAKFISLPDLHVDDIAEITLAIHSLQTKLMWRPTYRKYRA